MIDANTIEYEVINDDPSRVHAPWSMKVTYLRDPEAGEQWRRRVTRASVTST